MYEKEVEINYKPGLHVRPVSIIVQEANKYNSDIILKKENYEVSLKSLLGILGLGIEYGEKVIIKADGRDEQKAVNKLVELIGKELEGVVKSKFNKKPKKSKEIISKRIEQELDTSDEYDVDSVKVIELIGREVKNKISHIQKLIDKK